MKAVWYEKNGSPADVLVHGETDTPRPGPGQVLVRLATSGVNPSDVKSRRGRPMIAPRIIPHSDGAGIVEAVGEGVDTGRVGQRVWIWNGQWKRPFGTAAEFIAVNEEQAVPLADGVGFAEAACFGIPALTAIQAVNNLGDVDGKTILVTGAAAAVGHYATQIAVQRGARVIGTASPERMDHAASAGAFDLIDYRSEDVAARVKSATGGRGADGVIDMDFSTTAGMLPDGILAPHGTLVCYGSNVATDIPISFPTMLWGSLTLSFFLVYELTQKQRARAIADLDALLAEGALAHTIGARFPLAEAVTAHETVEAGRTIGNVVLEMG
jgi:NADPH2:quinone reductase